MPIYQVRDFAKLYPQLQEIAKLSDDGDDELPYMISDADIDLYFGPNPPDEPKIANQEIFKAVELYRQLAIYDRYDGPRDGLISPSFYDYQIILPSHAHAYHYWGKTWTPAQRLKTYLTVHQKTYAEIRASIDMSFPNARSFIEGHIDTSFTRQRPLYGDEGKFITDFAKQLDDRGFQNYGDMLRQGIKYMRVLNIYIEPKSKTPYTEAKERGFTYIFSIHSQPTIYLINYPELGQTHFFRPRYCKEVNGRKRCVPFVGKNTRGDVINAYLRPYVEGIDIARGKRGERLEYKWSRMPFYLSKARIYNYFRYDLPQLDSALFKTYARLLVLHETIHFRNTRNPFGNGSIFGALKHLSGQISDPYTAYHANGYHLMQVQRIALEGYLTTKRKLEDSIERAPEGGRTKEEALELNRLFYRFCIADQLLTLVEEAAEALVEEEVYGILFDRKDLKEFRWMPDEKELVLNPNEIELLRREE